MLPKRNKMSPPPPAEMPEGNRVTLLGLAYSSAYPIILDVIQGYAIEQEVEVFINEMTNPEATLHRVYIARAAWLVLDRIQRRVEQALEAEEDIKARVKSPSDEREKTTDEILGVE